MRILIAKAGAEAASFCGNRGVTQTAVQRATCGLSGVTWRVAFLSQHYVSVRGFYLGGGGLGFFPSKGFEKLLPYFSDYPLKRKMT